MRLQILKTVLCLAAVSLILCSCNSPTSSEESLTSAESSAAVSAKTAEDYAQAALNAVEFPEMEKYEDAETVDVIFDLDVSNYADYAIYSNLISIYLNRVIVVKPAEGQHDAVYEELKAFYDNIIENGAFYHEQGEAAAGAQMGETDDGFIYIIVHKDGKTAADALLGQS